MFSFEPYSVRKTKQINKACFPILSYSSAWMAADHSACRLSSHPRLVFSPYLPCWLFLISLPLVSSGPDGVCPGACVWGEAALLVSLSHSWNEACQKASGWLISGGCANTSLPQTFLRGLIVHEQCSSHCKLTLGQFVINPRLCWTETGKSMFDSWMEECVYSHRDWHQSFLSFSLFLVYCFAHYYAV